MQGSVTKKGKKWYVVIFLGVGEDGKKKYKWYSGYPTKKAAQIDLNKKIKEINDGTFIDSDNIPFGKYLEDWMKVKSQQVRPNTFRTYEWLTRVHILPNLGNIELKKLRPAQLQQLYTDMATREKPLSNRTIQQVHVLLHDALDRAVKWGLVARNIAEAVDAPRVEKNKGKSWTVEHTLRFLEAAAKDTYSIAFYLAVMTGMRKGEILGLMWEDIDWENASLQVIRSLTFIKGKPVMQAPKTEKGRRSIALSADVMKELKKHRRIQNRDRLFVGTAYDDHGLVVCRKTGQPLNPRNLDDAWYKLLKQTELPRIRFHDLRHTHASLMLQQGVHPKVVSERLGHSNINITLDIYSHVLPGLQQQAADNFSDALKRKKS